MRSLATLIVGVLAVGLGALAQDKTVIKKVPMKMTSAIDGAEMFKAYCASCHGMDADGNGPAAAALKKLPGNLTRLSERNNGKFPVARVQAMIQGAEGVDAHGSREMPVWGPLFRMLGTNPNSQEKLRIYNLMKYLESIQKL